MFKKNANSLSLTIKKLLGNIVHGFVWFMNKSLIKKTHFNHLLHIVHFGSHLLSVPVLCISGQELGFLI